VITRLRIVAAILLVAVGLVHLNLYLREHYREIPTIGWLFLLTVISAVVLAFVVVKRPRWWTDLSAVIFALGVMGSYLLTLWLPEGLFQFKEPGVSYSGVIALVAEAGIAVVLAGALFRDRQEIRPRVGLR
jgi:hypothetical protein